MLFLLYIRLLFIAALFNDNGLGLNVLFLFTLLFIIFVLKHLHRKEAIFKQLGTLRLNYRFRLRHNLLLLRLNAFTPLFFIWHLLILKSILQFNFFWLRAFLLLLQLCYFMFDLFYLLTSICELKPSNCHFTHIELHCNFRIIMTKNFLWTLRFQIRNNVLVDPDAIKFTLNFT